MSIDATPRNTSFSLPQVAAKAPEVIACELGGPKEIKFEQLSQAHAQTLGKTPANLNLPAPESFTLTPTTMAHLGALGDHQTSADISTFLALFQKLAQQMRDTARTQRSADMQAQVTSLQGAAEQMKDAAQSRYTASMTQGLMQIVGGFMQLSTGKDGFTGIGSGLGSMLSAGDTLKAGLADARRSELEADAKVFETGVQHANDTMQQMMDVIRDVREKLQGMQQSAIETNRGIARNI